MIGSRRDEFADYRESDVDDRIFTPPRFLPHLVILVLLIGGSLAAIHYFAGPKVFEDVLQRLASPVGAIWACWFVVMYWVTAWRIRLAMFFGWIGWIGLTVAGTSLTANMLIATLERPYASTDPFQLETFDAVVVLGGGTDTTPAGVPQLGLSGDRLILAARLYHADRTERIVVCGVRPSLSGANELQIHEESARILLGLGIPEENILRLEAGSNTAEEVDALKSWLAEQQLNRVGLLTSAWHLPRALRLAERKNVSVVGIPADFLSEQVRFGPAAIIPSARNLYISQIAVKEILARWFWR